MLTVAAHQNPTFLRTLQSTLGGCQRRQRSEKKPIPEEQKDEKYLERRHRNNKAAKRYD
jgi:hypothetical protein